MLGRQSSLIAYQRVGVTEEGYKRLRKLKVTKKKSMMAIIEDLINKEFSDYEQTNKQHAQSKSHYKRRICDFASNIDVIP